mmetsp:Transcript_83465/g.174668  ORF Transcript_83465/g.174668 Transcript_83465/m.174668 type:complete len:81 (+) Transcript_83465:401-643(+)
MSNTLVCQIWLRCLHNMVSASLPAIPSLAVHRSQQVERDSPQQAQAGRQLPVSQHLPDEDSTRGAGIPNDRKNAVPLDLV